MVEVWIAPATAGPLPGEEILADRLAGLRKPGRPNEPRAVPRGLEAARHDGIARVHLAGEIELPLELVRLPVIVVIQQRDPFGARPVDTSVARTLHCRAALSSGTMALSRVRRRSCASIFARLPLSAPSTTTITSISSRVCERAHFTASVTSSASLVQVGMTTDTWGTGSFATRLRRRSRRMQRNLLRRLGCIHVRPAD